MLNIVQEFNIPVSEVNQSTVLIEVILACPNKG